MKKLTVFCTALFALTSSAEIYAQTRGPRYNPPSGSSSSSSTARSSSTTRSSTTSTAPARTSTSTSSSSTVQRGPRYNPNPSSTSSSTSSSTARTSTSTARTSTSTSSSTVTQRGPRYNPNPSSTSTSTSTARTSSTTVVRQTYPSSTTVVTRPSTVTYRGPRYNPPVTSSSYRLPSYSTGRVIIYNNVVHAPYRVTYTTVRYNTYRDYHLSVDRRYIYRNWLLEPVVFSYSNGYTMINNYPYYVYAGYRYRYHPVELCQYQLVDSTSYTAVRTFGLKACSVAYDECAANRDNLNYSYGYQKHFCAEGVDYDLRNSIDDDYYRYANDIDDRQSAEIEQYLWGKSYYDIFSDASYYSVGNCRIERQSLYSSCSYAVKVGNYTYPQTDGSVCSSDYAASLMGCNVGSQEENAGCILKAAIQEGYCL